MRGSEPGGEGKGNGIAALSHNLCLVVEEEEEEEEDRGSIVPLLAFGLLLVALKDPCAQANVRITITIIIIIIIIITKKKKPTHKKPM